MKSSNKHKMRKPNTITVKNYKEFKPSEFVESFLTDIEIVEKQKKPMNMSDWDYSERWDPMQVDTIECLPCLGGMACMNMGAKSGKLPDIIVFEYDTTPRKRMLASVALLGDAIRTGCGDGINTQLKNLYPSYYSTSIQNPYFAGLFQLSGLVYPKSEKMKNLKHNIKVVVKALQKQSI